MATKNGQRVGIWVIAVVLVIGTLAGFVAMIIAPQNQAADQQRLSQVYEQYQKDSKEYEEKLAEQAKQESKKYYSTFKKFADLPDKFDAKKVTKLSTKDLKTGTGTTIDGSTKFAVYYIGWTPDGKIFDQSIDDKSLKSPFNIEGLDNTAVIDGWKEGLLKMKIGGVRVITIPSEKAYGEEGQGDSIPQDTPLKFVVMTVPAVETIEPPEIPKELLNNG